MHKRRFAFVANLDLNLFRFRYELIERLIAEGVEVWGVVPESGRDLPWEELGLRKAVYGRFGRSTNPIAAIRTANEIRRQLARIRPALVHTYTAEANTLGTFAAHSLGQQCIVNSVTGIGSIFISENGSPKQRLAATALRMLYRHAARRATRQIFLNEDDRRLFVREGLCDPSKAVLIRSSGVDTRRFSRENVSSVQRREVRSDLGLPEAAPVVIMVARLIRHKGILEFIEAADRLQFEYPIARFLVIGAPDPGNPTSLSENEIAALNARSNLILAGERAEVREYLAASDIFVLPSYREGVPRSALEAMAMELPIVTTDVPGCRDTVREGVNGFLVPARDGATLADRVGLLLANKGLRERMGIESRRRAGGEFSIEHVVDSHLELYRELLGTTQLAQHRASGEPRKVVRSRSVT